MGAPSTTELISVARSLGLDIPRSEANYEHLFGSVAASRGWAEISHLTTGLEGKRKLALLVACIWAKARAGEQNAPEVQKAASMALEIMGTEGVTLDRPSLQENCRWYRQSFDDSAGVAAGDQDVRRDAHSASRLLQVIVG